MALKVKAVEKFALPKSFPSISQALSKHIASSNSRFEYANTLPTPCQLLAYTMPIPQLQSLNKSDCQIECSHFLFFSIFISLFAKILLSLPTYIWKY